MKRIRMTIELEYNATNWHGDDVEANQWFLDEVIHGGNLQLGDFGDIGDTIGTVRVLEVVL